MAEIDGLREEYKKELDTITELLGVAINVSDSSGGIKTTTRCIRATQLYTRLVAATYSFVRLLPGNKITSDRNPFWDWGSVAVLARQVVEIYHAFYYLGVDEISKEEVDFRIGLMHLCRNAELLRLYQDWGAEKSELASFEKGLPLDRDLLQKNPFFLTLPEKLRMNLLTGKYPMHLSQEEVARRADVLGRHFRPLYRLLSNQMHATPLAFQSQSNERGRGQENEAELHYVTLATQIVKEHIGRAILDMAEMFPQQLEGPHRDELVRVKTLLNGHATEGTSAVN